MQVHICTLQIKLTTVTVSPSLRIGRQTLESVWRSDKGQIIVVGAIRSNIKNGKATFNQIFEIKTDLFRDPNDDGYLPSSLILQIRIAGQALNQRISNSICTLSINEMLNNQETTAIVLQSEDNTFVNNLEVKCLEVVKTGMKKSQKKLQRRVSKQKPSQNGVHEYSKLIERSPSLISKIGKNICQSKQNDNDEQMKEQYQKLKLEISKLKQQMLREKNDHAVTSEELKNAQLQLSEQEHVINQISALISQRETNIIQLNQKIEKMIDQNNKLNELNKKLKTIVQQLKTIQFKNTELQRYIAQRERQIQELKTKLGEAFEKEMQAKSYVYKEKQINIFLAKSIDQLKRDLNKKQQQITYLSNLKHSIQNEKEKLMNELKSLKEKYHKNQQQLKSDFVESAIKFNQLYDKYSKLKEYSVQTLGMVNRAQIQEVQKGYELKLKQCQEREIALKENVENIEKEMVQLQELLQEKEENQIKLIDFSRKLQLEVDRLEAQKQFWNRIHQNDAEQQEKYCEQDGQVASLKKKVKRLLLILRQNSDSILQSQKNKQEIILVQKENKQINHRLSLFRDESKQIKDKFIVLLKENKKLIERLHKTQRENEYLFKNNQKLSNELNLTIQKEKTTNEQYQILNYRMIWLEKQLAQVKSISNEQLSLQYVEIQMDKHDESEMGEIKQMSQEIISSRHYSRKDFEQNKGEVKQFNSEVIQELTSLFKQRINLNYNFCKTIDQKVWNISSKQSFQEVQRQLNQLTKLTTQLKRRLIQKGERESAVNLEKQIRKVTQQINKLQISH